MNWFIDKLLARTKFTRKLLWWQWYQQRRMFWWELCLRNWGQACVDWSQEIQVINSGNKADVITRRCEYEQNLQWFQKTQINITMGFSKKNCVKIELMKSIPYLSLNFIFNCWDQQRGTVPMRTSIDINFSKENYK